MSQQKQQQTQVQQQSRAVPAYTYMNYGQPTYYYQPQPTKMRYVYVPGQTVTNPTYIPGPQPVAQPQPTKTVKAKSSGGIGCNSNYLKSALGLLRIPLMVRIKI